MDYIEFRTPITKEETDKFLTEKICPACGQKDVRLDVECNKKNLEIIYILICPSCGSRCSIPFSVDSVEEIEKFIKEQIKRKNYAGIIGVREIEVLD